MLADIYSDTKTTVETRYGRLVTPGDQDVISHFLARCGEWAWDETAFVAATLPDDARVLDVGAFLGTFGLGIALCKRLSFVCLVEANPTILPLLEANIKANATSAAVVVGAMVDGEDRTLRPGRSDPLNLGSTSFATDETSGYSTEPPDCALTLADLRREHGHFDLIKLDVEGMEREILYCDRDYLAKGNTTLWVECNDSPRSLELVELLLSWGLEVHYFAFPSHNPDNFRGENEPIFPWGYEAGLLVAPKNPPRLDAELIAHGCILRPIGTVEDLREAMWRTPRGLPTELAHATAPELAAIAGRALEGQIRDVFLAGGVLPKETVWDRLKATQAGLSRAEALAFERQDQLNQERELRGAAQAGLSRAEALAFERQDQLNQEREQREAAEKRLAGAVALALTRLEELGAEREHSAATTTRLEQAEARVHTAERQLKDTSAQLHAAERQLEDTSAQLAAIRSTVMWRINIFIGSRPRLHAVLRRVRPVVGAVLRWRRRGAMT